MAAPTQISDGNLPVAYAPMQNVIKGQQPLRRSGSTWRRCDSGVGLAGPVDRVRDRGGKSKNLNFPSLRRRGSKVIDPEPCAAFHRIQYAIGVARFASSKVRQQQRNM